MNEFINQALIFIGATVLIVPLFKLSGFGSVLGYLVAGIIVGPHALKLIHDFESVMHMAELGVVLLLFIIGLEIQPRKLLTMRQELIGLGGGQVFLTSGVFFGCGVLYGLPYSTALILAFALSLSSTAFALQYLMEKNQFNTSFGQSSFSILLCQDILAIPTLAIIPLFAIKVSATSSVPSLMTIVYFIGLILFLILLSRYLIRPIFRLIASTRAQELFTATTLLVVFGVAALTLSIGLSAALGTFIAGVLLADSEYRHELEANLDPFKSLLMGLFFISVGMSVSIPLIIDQPFLILGLTVVYMMIKYVIIYLIGRLSKMNHENSKLMGLAIGQGGEFAFVIFGMVLTMGIAEFKLIGILTSVITVSMAFSPILNMLNDSYISRSKKVGPVYDDIKDENPEIIIAGFGRFGQIFGRILKSQNIQFVAIDHDASQVDSLRKFGHKVYFGDTSRKEILEKAGIAKTRYFILAIDNLEQSLATARLIHEHYPHVKIFARARNRGHVFELMELGVKHIKRETFDSSLKFVEELFVEMGIGEERAKNMIEGFRTHDEIMLQEQFKVRKDEDMFVSVIHQGQEQLTQIMAQESQQFYIK